MTFASQPKQDLLFFVKDKEIFRITPIISVQGVIKLAWRQFIALDNPILLVSEIKIAHDIMNVGVTVNRTFASGKSQSSGQIFSGDVMPHCKYKVSVISYTEGSPVGQKPIRS